MAYSVTTLLNDLGGVIHGSTINKVPNIYGIINRAARDVLLDVDPKETQRIIQLSQVFNSVYDYPCPTDLKGDRFIDIRPQAGRKASDVYFQGYETDFDANKAYSFSNKLYVQFNTGVKTIRIQAPSLTSPITLGDTSSITPWSVSGGASNLTLDQTNNVAGGGALQFDLSSSSSATIQASTLNSVDLTTKVSTDTLFYWVYLPTGSGITSLTLRWGSDVTANYYTATSTINQQGTVFVNGWNLISVPWVNATKVGTPVVTTFKAVLLTIAYNGTAQTGVKFCNLTSNTGYIFEGVYYSKFLFRDPSTNAFQETIVDVTDNAKVINLDTDSYNLLFNKSAEYVAQSLQGADAEFDVTFFSKKYDAALVKYKAKNPSEAMIKSAPYYTVPRKGYSF